jgi:hypothetical protein
MNNYKISKDCNEIEIYIENEFLPIFFGEFKKKKFIIQEMVHTTSFENKNTKYVFRVLILKSGYSGYLYIVGEEMSEIVFPKKNDIKELFSEITKSMKEYRLSKLYK